MNPLSPTTARPPQVHGPPAEDPPVESPSPAGWHVLCDEFSWQGWRFEGAERVLPPRGLWRSRRWQRLLRDPPAESVSFLLIESAWENFRRREDRFEVPIRLAEAYRRRGIPVVFWNKEDPLHYERFLPLAKACDIVLTTDGDSLGRYRRSGFAGPLDVMTFAAQPRLHRPYLPKHPDRKLFFAGTLRPHHEDRMRGFDNVILPALDLGLEIFSRRGRWPQDCRKAIRGSYPYTTLLGLYSAYAVGLSISSITDSPTMFPRRLVEMPMADILVISDRCRAAASLLPDIPQSDSPRETRRLIRHFLSDERDRLQVVAATQEEILKHHTCAHRVSQFRGLIEQSVTSRS